MGIDLTIAPIRYDNLDWWLTTDKLTVERDYYIFGQIDQYYGRDLVDAKCQPHPVPPDKRVDWYEDEGIKTIKMDCYGRPLTYLTAGELMQVDILGQEGHVNEWNFAVWSFLDGLPQQTPVLLYWH